jgi:uncharacterized metal-binding protein YceD (DUF177 family)
MKNKNVPVPEWSYMFDVSDLPENGCALTISPDEEECVALVRRLDLEALNNLRADIAVTPDRRGTIHVQGIITARVTQNCVTTFTPVVTEIKDDFDAWFGDAETIISFEKAKKNRNNTSDERPVLSEQEDPEALIDGKIDLGETVVQFLSLALPAYPHAEGVKPVGDDPMFAGVKKREKPENPFAALKDWKDKQR